MAEGGDSAECKRLGRQIHPFVEEKWVTYISLYLPMSPLSPCIYPYPYPYPYP